ncbi:MAG: isoleucine--tRNA ligase [Thermodesulfobacteriota bacterium]|nr:MAG: isoleucine--tRNA ligase [Thermodesulfobacteriota bacterium]
MSEANKVNYKDTLNLPRTTFPMKANLNQKEPEIQKRWDKINLYERIRENSQGKDKFIFHDGPPYANGPIHLGHLLNKVLKDIVVRSKTMLGYNVDFIPGWDCHGLPIEHKVLKDLGDKAKDLNKLKIRYKCQADAEKYVKMQSKQMKRLGTIGNYENPYLTMTPDYEAGVLEVFSKLVERGLIYRDLKPVHWSIENQTALADAELEYYDRKDRSIYVLFEIENADSLPKEMNLPDNVSASLLIWTTTPWTLPANLAVAVSSDGDYGLYKVIKGGEEYYTILVETLAEKVFGKAGADSFEKIGTCKGKDLADAAITYKHPFADRISKLVTAEYVTFEDGTGLVHTAPGHGVDDYQTGLKEGLDIYCPVLGDGTFDDTVPKWIQGVNVWKGNNIISDHLRESGHLFHDEEYLHSYPHDWRSKTPTIFRATEQWFVGVDKTTPEFEKSLRELGLNATENIVAFYPEWGKNRLRGMLESRPDWCISRQRAWGLPIPAFVNENDEILLTPASVKIVIEKIREHGANFWFKATAEEIIEGYDPKNDDQAPKWAKQDGALDNLKLGMDIFDVWFESGSSWHSVLEQRDIGYPADLYLEGSDQHRGWFQLSLLPALGATGIPPFKALLTHGFMVDAQGRKMSKSGGNALEVEELLKTNGADICRWWVSSLKYTNDIKVDLEFFKVAADEYRKVRNTIRFLLGNINDFDPAKDSVEFADDDKYSLDSWAMSELSKFITETNNAYQNLDYKKANELIFHFCYETLSAVYLAAIKDRLYCEKSDSRKRRRSQTAMYNIADALIRLLSPILVHTSDEAYRSLKNEEQGTENSVHLLEMPQDINYATDSNWDNIMELRGKALKALEDAKATDGISNPLDTEIVVNIDSESFEAFKPFESELADLCGVSKFSLSQSETFQISVKDLSDELRCERSWKRDGTVKERFNGAFLSDRDAEALGIS